MTIPTYSTGTVSVADGSSTLNFSGAILSRTNARAGDTIFINNQFPGIDLLDVVDLDTATIPVPWSGGDQTNVPYTIIQNFPDRVAGVEAAKDVSTLVAALNKDGFIWFVGPDETEPDPSRGDEGQYGYQPSTGKKWVKLDGAWSYLGVSDAVFSRYDLTLDLPGRPESGAIVARWLMPSAVTFGVGLPQTVVKSQVAATASKVFTLRRNNVAFATFKFAVGATAPTIVATVATTCAANDMIDLVAPAAKDNTLADIVFTIVGLR